MQTFLTLRRNRTHPRRFVSSKISLLRDEIAHTIARPSARFPSPYGFARKQQFRADSVSFPVDLWLIDSILIIRPRVSSGYLTVAILDVVTFALVPRRFVSCKLFLPRDEIAHTRALVPSRPCRSSARTHQFCADSSPLIFSYSETKSQSRRMFVGPKYVTSEDTPPPAYPNSTVAV
jgi:hypothetical protein